MNQRQAQGEEEPIRLPVVEEQVQTVRRRVETATEDTDTRFRYLFLLTLFRPGAASLYLLFYFAKNFSIRQKMLQTKNERLPRL